MASPLPARAATASRSAPSTSTTYSSAKDLLEKIGAEVQREAYSEAKTRSKGKLEGVLSQATYPGDERSTGSTPPDPCLLDHRYHTNVTDGHNDPCGNKRNVRFSDIYRDQCNNKKIKGNEEKNDKESGACAPFRRLFLCDQNLAYMPEHKINNTHNLLLEVSLAAQNEGKLLVEKYKEYKVENPGFDTNICTILSRSFADIGDIIRGKDLFLGNEQEKLYLESNLKRIFRKLKESLDHNIQAHYEDKDENFYLLREDWWALNRRDVWDALTCKAEKGDTYSKSVHDGKTILWDYNCGHKKEAMLTNLDYVPQFLRWFEEWGEDFCRIRYDKLEKVKEACRDDEKKLYCSQNGYDCTKPIWEKGASCTSSDCNKCSSKCYPYQIWLDDRGNEFKKQKVKYDKEIEKYEKEIEKYIRNKDKSVNNINNKYYKKFYDKLKDKGYGTVNNFLKLLNEGKYCKKKLKDEEDFDFNKTGEEHTFYRSEYCQPCPDCVVECDGGKCEPKEGDKKCRRKLIEDILRSEQTTEIDVLHSGNGQGVITEKLKDFCSNPTNYKGANVQEWKCYNKNNDYNNCEMNISSYKEANDRNLMVSVECFHSWAQNLLIDTIRWEHQLKNCINNTNVTDCKSNCNNNCKCYEEWIKQKVKEWQKVKDVIGNKNETSNNYYKKVQDLFHRFLYLVIHELEKEEKDGKWDQFMDDLKKKIETFEKSSGTGNSKDAVKLLLDHLKDNAITCKDNNSNESCPSSKVSKGNPCIKSTTGSKNLVSVKRLAELKQQKAHTQLEKRGGKSNLKGDASKGTYTRGGEASDFKEKLCDINKNHSNRNDNNSKGPCAGKGTGDDINTRFIIGTVWQRDPNYIRDGHQEFIIPPRRRHICTSNLEYLETNDTPFSNNNATLINDSFLGDVMLSAKDEAKNIIEKYIEKNNLNRDPKQLTNPNDQATVCRAIRYSFADIGDIIRGRDIWDNETGMKKIREYLPTIFGKIKKKVPDKYDNDKDYKKLREDWWEANRHQVWRAMKCATQNIENMKCNGIPIEDYIPQRLRWMSEWSEWYCKFESQARKECMRCEFKNNPGNNECSGDTNECKKYKDKIDPWKDQWRKLQIEYSNLYADAQIAAGKGVRDDYDKVQDKDKPVYDFLYDLHVKNGGTVGPLGTPDDKKPSKAASNIIDTMYKNAGAYVHDLVDLSDCKGQIDFCIRGKTFKPTPSDDETDPEEDQDPAPEEEKPVDCTTVEGILQNANEKNPIGNCNVKTDKPWECSDSSFDKHNKGACMPPRRQRLCVYFFAGNNVIDQNKIKDQNELKEAFIKSAAAEMFFAWHKYKNDNNNDPKLQVQLEKGKIPEEFKRQMFYTFGDYRDFVFGTDISTGHGKNSKLGKKIDSLFPENGGRKHDDLTRENWWEKHGPEIWHGMLCALEKFGANKETLTTKYPYSRVKFSGGNNPPTLEEFAQRPQFLRWFTEWGEEFCKKRKEQVEILQDACKEYECGDIDEGKKKKCADACKEYQTWLQTWKDQYEKQNSKFMTDKHKYNDDPDIEGATYAYQYLSKKLKPICQNGTTADKCDYNCMENASKQQQTPNSSQQQQENTSSTQNHFPEAFDYPPKEIGDKCNCPKLPEPKYCVDKTAYDIRKEAETKVKNIDDGMKGKGNDFNSKCNKVNKNNVTGNDSCNFDKTYKESLDSINETCKGKGVDRLKIGQKWNSKYITKIGKDIFIPPRREHICLHDLNTLMPSTIHDRNDLLKKIQDVAKIEGDDIIKKLLPQYPCNEDVICKAMKYSFADLGDIIRGRDMLLGINSANAYETTLKGIFEKIKTKWENENYTKNKGKYPDLPSFRSAWWDANRESIWKSMTCNAPDEAKIYITKEGGYISPLTLTKKNCGHNDDPPDYDYIPQPLRWISEWSEQFCLYQKHLLETMKNCENCNKKDNNEKCQPTVHGACTDCKKKCEKYNEFIEIWKKQFETQKKAYEEIYKKATRKGGNGKGIDEDIKKFVEKLEQNCQKNSVDTADKYLEGGSVCRRFKFVRTHTHEKNYAFHNTPLSYKEHCECAKDFDPLDECPVDKNECEKYSRYPCRKNHYNKNQIEWTNHFVKTSIRNYEAVMVPPRRRHLCIVSISTYGGRINTEKQFKEYILHAASNEAKFLWSVHKSDEKKALQAIKYSFADIGNIVKDDDMLDDGVSDKIKNIINKINSKITQENDKLHVKNWWEKNKHKVWNVMMCHYNGSDKKKDRCPSHADIDEEDQFLRWMTEWATYFCNEKKKEVEKLIEKCKTEITTNGLSSDIEIKKGSCHKVLHEYNNWLHNRNNEWKNLDKKYKEHKNANSSSTSTPMPQKAQEYVNKKCNDCKCDFDNIIEKYDKSRNGVSIIHSLLKDLNPKKKCGEDTSDKSDKKPPAPLPPPPAPPPLAPADEPFDPTILQTTIPFGVALALGSIAFLFLKKKTQAPVDLFSVINIPKSDYDIPTLKSSNRYIPYASDRHKGKTYIYMEGDSSGDEKYAFMSDTTDVTSSESEYEELDINDIYVPGSPKYKTLIEVVLEPSKRDIPSGETPINKFTDEEWNQLKHDFISNMLQNQPKDVQNDYKSENVPLNTQPNTLYFNKPQEKPFITSIHDRNLYSGEEYSYNVNMVNSMDDIPISGKNDVYSGIDLINDSLNNNKVDIYDEVLKRKENELFGTNHPKHTNTHNVTKSSNSDPIDNQLDLFHTWLDRHRDMCEQWNNKEELLDKLKEEWNKDNNSGDVPSDNNKTLNTDVSIQIHMDNPKPINEFTNMDTILEDLDKYNEPYYDVQDDIYYDVNDRDASTADSNNMDVPSKVQIEMDVNTKLVKEKYPIADVWDI
ncbi:erythrocyte membrane protein 1, PfEMP1, putative [Plasmodium sp. gorilla clade G1]|nr:erythrocyte membrane protein 1, PfEMP1, putative [Plasmodium sp. gorilla clade G1]